MTTGELVSAYYRAFNEKKFDEMLSFLSDDVIHDVNQGPRTTGKDAFRTFNKDMELYYDEFLDKIVIMISPDGKHAAAEFVCKGTYKSTAPGLPPARGQKYELPVGCFFEIKAGKITRVTNYYNMKDWLKQVE